MFDIVAKIALLIIMGVSGDLRSIVVDGRHFAMYLCTFFLFFMAIWSAFRTQINVFIYKDVLARTAIEYEKNIMCSNYIWFLV